MKVEAQDMAEGKEKPISWIQIQLKMEGQTLPEELSVYQKHQRRIGLKWETLLRRKEKEAADLFKSGILMEAIHLMESLIDYCLEMEDLMTWHLGML